MRQNFAHGVDGLKSQSGRGTWEPRAMQGFCLGVCHSLWETTSPARPTKSHAQANSSTELGVLERMPRLVLPSPSGRDDHPRPSLSSKTRMATLRRELQAMALFWRFDCSVWLPSAAASRRLSVPVAVMPSSRALGIRPPAAAWTPTSAEPGVGVWTCTGPCVLLR